MRKDLGPKSYIYPMPVLIIGTYCEDGTPDAMNAAWGESAGIMRFPSISVHGVKRLRIF